METEGKDKDGEGEGGGEREAMWVHSKERRGSGRDLGQHFPFWTSQGPSGPQRKVSNEKRCGNGREGHSSGPKPKRLLCLFVPIICFP